MKRFLWIGLLLAIWLLVSCGGGEPAPPPQAFAQPLRSADPTLCVRASVRGAVQYRFVNGECTSVLAPPGAASAATAAALRGAPLRAQPSTFGEFLLWAEATYPDLFHGSRESGTYEGYVFRYYPATGHYLAVRTDFTLYALGPATDGEIVHLGALGNLLCAVYPPNCASASSDFVPGDASTAIALSFNVSNVGSIEHEGDQDWYQMTLSAGTAYTFDMEGVDSAKGTLTDPVLKVLDANGVQVASNDDVSYPGNRNARIVYTPPASGRYFLAAGAYGTAAGSFELRGTHAVAIPPAPGTGSPPPTFAGKAAAGYGTSAIIKADGSLWVWGHAGYDGLGVGTVDPAWPYVERPRKILDGVRSVALGYSNGAAVKADGSLWTWGSNRHLGLADQSATSVLRTAPARVGEGYSMASLAWYSGAGVKTDGTLWVWGSVHRNAVYAPQQAGSGFVTVAAGNNHLVAVKADGTLWGWGKNGSAQLGPALRNATGGYTTELTMIGSGFAAVTIDDWRTYGLKRDGTVWVYGSVPDREWGDYSPRLIGEGFVSISAGDTHLLAAKSDGSVWAYGNNANGRFGNGTTSTNWTTALQRVGVSMQAVAAGLQHSVGLGTDGAPYEWGGPFYLGSQLGTDLVVPTNAETVARPSAPPPPGGTGGTGGLEACAGVQYPGTGEPQVLYYDQLAQFDQCAFRATGDTRYVTDGNRQCSVLDGLLSALGGGTFRPLFCNGPLLRQ